MKTFCEVCTAAPASLVCCADDAVICGTCDTSIHAANTVVGKHERVAFKSTAAKPMCDICQENPVFAICREDRAFLCRTCDVAIHSANEHVAKHERFLMTGVTVELNAMPSTSNATETVAAPAVQVKEATPVAAAPKKTKGTKRKAVPKQDSFSDLIVPTFVAPLDTATNVPADAEFQSFAQDFLGTVGKGKDDVNMANFLDNFFDDIPESEDFGVVPDMGFVQ